MAIKKSLLSKDILEKWITQDAPNVDKSAENISNALFKYFSQEGVSEVTLTNTGSSLNVDLDSGDTFRFDNNAGAVTNINLSNGFDGKTYTLIIKSSGVDYTWSSNIKWPSDSAPNVSAAGKTDIFSFIKVDNFYCGTFAFNFDV